MFHFKKYDDDVLKHLQKVELMILKDVASFCDENDIDYFMYGGSALGTVRHKGFIPWDDDVDIAMFREDYEKFIMLANKLDSKYDILNYNNDDNYPYTFTKVSLRNTRFEEPVIIIPNEGIFIDVFPLDNIPNNKIKRRLHVEKCRFLRTIYLNSCQNFVTDSKIKNLIHSLLYHFFNDLHLKTVLLKKLHNNFIKYDDEITVCVTDHFSANLFYYNKNDFKPTKLAKFENFPVKIPQNVDFILTQIYGDYMQLPPEEERYNHCPVVLDFGEY